MGFAEQSPSIRPVMPGRWVTGVREKWSAGYFFVGATSGRMPALWPITRVPAGLWLTARQLQADPRKRNGRPLMVPDVVGLERPSLNPHRVASPTAPRLPG